MTDPVLRLNPCAQRGSRAGCSSSVERPPRRLAHRAAQIICDPPPRCAPRRGLRAGGVLASADRRQLAAAEADGRRLGATS